MSTRLILVAARNCTRENFTQAFALDQETEVHEDGGFLWYLASFWGSDRSAVGRGMAELPGPNIFMETHDGCFWNLFIHEQGQKPFFCHHDFSWLGVSRDPEDYDEEDGDSFLEDEAQAWEFFGHTLPEELSQVLGGSDGHTAILAYYQRQAEYMADALARFGIPHTRGEVVSILNGEAVTDNELETEIGNLPRLLVSLGFGQYFEDVLQSILSPEEEEADSDDEPYAFDFARMEDYPLVAIAEGPCEVSLADVGCLLQIACFCDLDVELGMRMGLPAGKQADFVWEEDQWPEPELQGNFWTAGVREAVVLDMDEGKDIFHTLEQLPSGSTCELATFGEWSSAGCHRYFGTVSNGVFRIDASHPALSRSTLTDAVDLIRLIRSDEPISARDQAELTAVLDASQADLAFALGGRLDHVGLQFVIEEPQRMDLVKHLFRRRFSGTWGVETAAALEREANEELSALAESLAAVIPGVRSTNEIVYHGTNEVFYQADPSAVRSPEKIAAVDAQLEAMGFRFVGDFCGAARFKDILIHGYTHPAEAIYGVLFLGLLGVSFDFFTRFDDGSSATTTSLPSVQVSASRDRVFQCGATEDLHTLFNRHIAFIGKKRLQGVHTVPFGHSAKDLAKEIDDFLSRL